LTGFLLMGVSLWDRATGKNQKVRKDHTWNIIFYTIGILAAPAGALVSLFTELNEEDDALVSFCWNITFSIAGIVAITSFFSPNVALFIVALVGYTSFAALVLMGVVVVALRYFTGSAS